MQDRLKPRYSGRVSVPRTAGPIVLGLELPVYQRYENSLHVASKDRIKNLAYANFWSHRQLKSDLQKNHFQFFGKEILTLTLTTY